MKIMVGYDGSKVAENALKLAQKLANAFDADGRVGIDWGVYGAPETFIMDQQGIIRHKHIGPLSVDALNNEILPLIAELQSTP